MKFQIVISFEFPYIHRWEGCSVEGKEYLRNAHRHSMKCRAWLDVSHADRDVEFIDLKERVAGWAREVFAEPGPFSCEQIAEALIHQFRFARVEVLEDGENGAVVER
jgi:hypothetical protein